EAASESSAPPPQQTPRAARDPRSQAALRGGLTPRPHRSPVRGWCGYHPHPHREDGPSPAPLTRSDPLSIRSVVQPRRRGQLRGRDLRKINRLSALADHVCLHRKVLGEADGVDDLCRGGIPLLDPLPELAIVRPWEWRSVFLTLVLENGQNLLLQLVLRHRHEYVRFGDAPLLPGAAVVPQLRHLALIA